MRNIGALDGNRPVSDNDWEAIIGGGEAAIERWIADQMSGKSCAVVLIGSATAGRKWITYEISKAWNDGKGVVGIYVHNLKDAGGSQSTMGSNPFSYVSLKSSRTSLSSIVKAYDPPYSTSSYVYDHIKENVEAWVDEAVRIRANY